MRKRPYFLVVAAVVAAALLLDFLPGPSANIEIPPGLSAMQTAALLKERGIINSALTFRIEAKLLRADRDLKPGLYHFRKLEPAVLVVLRLVHGSEGVRILVPEGFSARQIAERLEANGVCKAYDFMLYAEKNHLEGYLFPATYFFTPGEPPAMIAQRMMREFQNKMAPLYKGASPRPFLTLPQTLALASIVEREAHLQEEKPMIAGVYINRLRKRMRLQADPTVQYALGYWKTGLTLQDLKIDSPYNTYLHYGLPPGPICNPGVSSLQAVLHPANTPALYFVADNKGGHVFSETNAEQIKAKMAFKKGLKLLKEKAQEKNDSLWR